MGIFFFVSWNNIQNKYILDFVTNHPELIDDSYAMTIDPYQHSKKSKVI